MNRVRPLLCVRTANISSKTLLGIDKRRKEPSFRGWYVLIQMVGVCTKNFAFMDYLGTG